jgi:hypothetical protein
MASLESLRQLTALTQDMELSQALNNLNKNPAELQQYLQQAQDKLYGDVVKRKDDTIQKVYGDMQRASAAHKSIMYYKQRNEDLSDLQRQVYEKQKQTEDSVVHDKDLSKRQYEINQWFVSNKLETLFVYQMVFIGVSVIALMTYMWSRGFISSGFYYLSIVIILIVVVFTITMRTRYTKNTRDNRYWNRKKMLEQIPAPGSNGGGNSCITDQLPTTDEAISRVTNVTNSGIDYITGALTKGLGAAQSGIIKGSQELKSGTANLSEYAKQYI